MTTTAGLTWAVKDSLVAYVEGLADGAVEALAPASRAAQGFWFPHAEEPPGTAAGDAVRAWQFLGAVRLTGHWGALDVELRDPRVELDGGHGTLLIRERGGRDPDARLPFADLVLVGPASAGDGPAGDDVAALELAASLTGHGRLLLGGQYGVGEPLSPLRVAVPGHGVPAPLRDAPTTRGDG
ncbi:HtaA domain-containing protein [Georgenia thermotolerans]|uniref:Htaa domain-containing protein n=1 Tax=Georgenia thermotolerans TaxID=527326 RepID=A0A7J5US73_9MICO|nr:HtaA domain-containing protein [Georgenia thermotolerans]KAE8765312.1 hypothetical protein GB883_04515 [Georgenia thermotolerans]